MSAIVTSIHIDTTSSSAKPLPPSPIPLSTSSTLTPSTQLRIPIANARDDKPQQLANLADAMDTTRANLNKILTAWKNWAGKEDSSNQVATNNDDDDDDDDEEEEEEEEEEDDDQGQEQ